MATGMVEPPHSDSHIIEQRFWTGSARLSTGAWAMSL